MATTQKRNKLYYQPGIPGALIYWSVTIGIILLGCIWEMESATFHWWALILWVPGAALAVYGLLGNTVTLSTDGRGVRLNRVFWLKPKEIRFANMARVETTRVTRTIQYKHPRYMRHELVFFKKDRARFDTWTATVRHTARLTEPADKESEH